MRSASTSRPMMRSTTSKTSSPICPAASSTARWRARLTSASALPRSARTPPGPSPRLGGDLLGRMAGLGHDLAGLLASLFEGLAALVVGRGRVGARALGGLERGADLLLALLHRPVQGGRMYFVIRKTMIKKTSSSTKNVRWEVGRCLRFP